MDVVEQAFDIGFAGLELLSARANGVTELAFADLDDSFSIPAIPIETIQPCLRD
jgi:hypothetical protein